MKTASQVAKAKHAAAERRYQAAILGGTTAQMTAALDAREAAFAELMACSGISGAVRVFAEAA